MSARRQNWRNPKMQGVEYAHWKCHQNVPEMKNNKQTRTKTKQNGECSGVVKDGEGKNQRKQNCITIISA